jgi:hypothetical protein
MHWLQLSAIRGRRWRRWIAVAIPVLMQVLLLAACGRPEPVGSGELPNATVTADIPTEASPAERPDPPGVKSAAVASLCRFDAAKPPISMAQLAVTLGGPEFKRKPYEDSATFDIRVEKPLADAKRLVGDGHFTFIVPVPASQVLFDTKASTITVNPAPLSQGLLPTIPGNGNQLVLVRRVRSIGTVSAHTAFAGQHSVANEEEDIVAVNVRGGDYVRWPKGFKALVVPIAKPTARHKMPAPQVGVLFAARLQSPYVMQEVTRQTPRDDFPRNVTSYITSILVDVDCAMMVDSATETVLAPLLN